MQRRNRAFTLIELLVVIAIIAILAAILFPVFAQAKRAAKSTVDLSNVKEIVLAIEMHKADHDGNYAKGWFNDEIGGEQTGAINPFWGWDMQVMPYIKNKGVFQSPLDTESLPRGRDTTPTTPTFTNPGNVSGGPLGNRADEDNIPASYRLNISNGQDGPWRSMNESAIPYISDMIIIAPSRPQKGSPDVYSSHHIATWEWSGVPTADPHGVCIDHVYNVQYDRNNNITGKSYDSTMAQRAQGRANYGFGDGHAKGFAWRQTWKRVDVDVTKAGQVNTPNMWRQDFSGYDDRCNYREGETTR